MSTQGEAPLSGDDGAPPSEPRLETEIPFQLKDERFPTPGASWLNTYVVRSPIERAQCGPSWSAADLSTKKAFVIVWVRSTDPRHDEAWDRLRSCNSHALLKATEGRLIDDRRFEIFEDCGGIPLIEWRAANPAPTNDVITAWIRDLADAIEILQRNGLIHSRIEPDNLFVAEDRMPPRLILGGLESVASFARTEAVPLPSDPFYGPPEAEGKPSQPSGEALLVWDWWCVGRVIQELVLGRHILEHMLDFKMSRQSVDDREFAAKLLLERAHGNTRAGGIEAMPAMDKRIDLLLHGLLTTSADARWGLLDVRQWLQGETPASRYAIGRDERLFRWRGRAWTVQEVAEVMRSAEFWEEARRHVFNAAEKDTLSYFLRSEPSMAVYAQKIDETSALVRSPELNSQPPVPLRELILSIALQKLAGGPLIHRGRIVDNTYLRDLANADNFVGTHLPLIQALTNAAVIVAIEKVDPAAGRMLSDCAKLAQRALDRCLRQRWLQRTATAETMRMWGLAFEAASVSQSERQELKDLYAMSDLPEVDALFKAENNAPDEILVLAWMRPAAQQKYGFITHEIWEDRQQAALTERGRALANVLFWKRLRRTLNLSPILYGNVSTFVLTWVLLGLVLSFAWPGYASLPAALLPLLTAVALRVLLRTVLQPLITARMPKAKRWLIRDGVARCDRELASMPERTQHDHEIAAALEEINVTLSSFGHLDRPATAILLPPRFGVVRTFALLSWVIFLASGFAAVRHLRTIPQPLLRFQNSWNTRPPDPDANWYPPAQKTKQDFPFVMPKHPPMIVPIGEGVASPAIIRAARRLGAYLAQDYKPKDIGAPLLVQVPTDKFYGFMVYDPTTDAIVGNNVIILNDIPPRRVFMSVDGRVVFVPNY